MVAMHREIGAYDAKTKLPELLRDVSKGDHFTITLRGRPVAELAPAPSSRKSVEAAVAAKAAFEPISGVTAKTLEEWVAEGRR